MEKRRLDSLGWEVSRIGLGTAGFGAKVFRPVDEKACRATLEVYVAAGGNFIDTARNYGQSERIIGETLGGARSDLYLCSKSEATSERQLHKDFKKSLGQLQTDWLDVYYMHGVWSGKLLKAYLSLKRSGDIRAIGVSLGVVRDFPDEVDVVQALSVFLGKYSNRVRVARSVLGRGAYREQAQRRIAAALGLCDVVLVGARKPWQIPS